MKYGAWTVAEAAVLAGRLAAVARAAEGLHVVDGVRSALFERDDMVGVGAVGRGDAGSLAAGLAALRVLTDPVVAAEDGEVQEAPNTGTGGRGLPLMSFVTRIAPRFL